MTKMNRNNIFEIFMERTDFFPSIISSIGANMTDNSTLYFKINIPSATWWKFFFEERLDPNE